MKDSGIIWNRKTLNTFLANPLAMVPGSTMGIAGINNEQDRRALILYIESASRSKEICGSG
jgi:cytochrome c